MTDTLISSRNGPKEISQVAQDAMTWSASSLPLPQPHPWTSGASPREENQHRPGPLMDLHQMPAPARSGLRLHYNLSGQGQILPVGRTWGAAPTWTHGWQTGWLTGWSGAWGKWNCIDDEKEVWKRKRRWSCLSRLPVWGYSAHVDVRQKAPTWRKLSVVKNTGWPLLRLVGSLPPAAPVLAYWVRLQSGHNIRREAPKIA